MTTDSMIEVEMPRQFERLQNTVIEAIIESSARITHGRRITLELRNFTILKQLLKRRKIKGLSVKTNWFRIGAGRFRMVVYPKGDSRSQSHLSFFIQKEKSAAGSCMCFLWYTLSISGISDLSRSSTGRFANTDEELGWSEFVDLGVLLDIYRGYIVDDIITFHADVHVLGEDFYRGNVELRLQGFDVNPKVEGEPTIWVIANFSAFLDVMATSIIVGPSFKFGKLALHVVIMIKGEYLYGRLDCDASSLTDYEKNVEISYSMGFYVHGEGRRKLKYRYSKLLLQSMNNDGVSLKKVSEMPATRNEYGVTVSCRILGLLRTCKGIPIQEQAGETASHENNSDIVAWYPPPIYSLTSSSIHGDVSASTPHLSGASTASAVLPGPNTVRGFGHAKAEVTQQRTLSDDSTTDHTSTTGLGKNLIDDHDLKASFALDTLKPAQVPRDIDLSPGQPLQSNQPSGSLGVIGGRSISDLGAFSDNIGGSSANSGGMHDQVHNLQMLNASLDMPATVLQPMAPTMKGEKQKGENTQGSETSSPSPGAFNLTDFSCELGVGSTIASLETAIPQIMAVQEMLNQSMNLEIDMQKQLMTMVSAPAEDSRRLEIVGERMDKLLKANTDALWDRIQKETGKREKLVREHTEQMTSLITNFINKDLPALVEKTVKKEFTAIEKAVSVAIEKAVSVAIAEAFQKEVGGKAINQLEKSVNLKLEATVARQIQAQLQTSGKQTLQETLKSSLEGPVIRAFEMSCKALFEKVDTTFQKEMIDHATVAQQQFESTHSPLALALRDAVNSASSLTQTLSGELYDGQRKLLALAATGANSNKIEAPLDLTKELSRLVSEHKYEEAFATALQRLDVSIVSWLCYQVDLHCILAMVPLPLSQVVLLFLLQQLACDISKDTTQKLAWMTGVAVAFNPSDPMIAVYVRSILEDVYGKLNHYRSLPTASSTERSNICLLMHVIKSMLMSDFFSIFRPLLFFLDR